ncbi:CAP domain-containing protein [Actinoplanes sp. NEAU-A12]|uniref:CAP domain-containing protein n=1 Tax=Actinoplanes sandaracinus TaxID=3045177 RepID=A0ABT6WGB4_9ACTN|nr:CAP domain-containing protein [Actinoplanes sandaracinus]MDI6098762.1 CAP domain-containing protein [Actinoplanes sandaracinus]
MPTPPNRRIRYTLMVIGALGMIGAGSAAIVVGSGSGDREVRLAATTPDATGTAGTVETAETADTAEAAEAAGTATSASPSTQPTASPSAVPAAPASATAAPSPSTTAAARSQAQPKSTVTKQRVKSSAPAPNSTTKAPSGGDTASSAVAAEVVRLVNVERQKAGCSGLSSESRLEAAAQKHSELQAERNSMSHQLPGEAGMSDRVTAEGYRWRSVGENVAAGYSSAASVMDGWMNSPGHKANILNCGFKEIGVGLAKSSSGTQYWTQNFATPA